MGSFMGRGNQYIQLIKVLYCKLPTISKKGPSSQHKVRRLTPCDPQQSLWCKTGHNIIILDIIVNLFSILHHA